MNSPENDEHKLKPAVFKALFDRHYPAVCRRLTGLLRQVGETRRQVGTRQVGTVLVLPGK